MNSVILIGCGEIGGVFARGLLKNGHTICPVNRGDNMSVIAQDVPEPKAVIVTVGEKDLQDTLKNLPDSWRDRLILVQNELLPRDWQQHELEPTVISIWFEKKPGQDVKVIVPSPIFGAHAAIVINALNTLNIPTLLIDNKMSMLKELVLKNLYILTTNIAGLKVGGNVGELWKSHELLAREIAQDVLAIQYKLSNKELHSEALILKMAEIFDADPDHKCMGRSAPARLARALQQADELGLDVKTLHQIKA